MIWLRRFLIGSLPLALVLASATWAQGMTFRSLFMPSDYASLGTLNASSGTIAIDTNALTITGFGNGVAATSQGGGVEMAIFTFDAINLGSGVTLQVTGNRGLVLGAKSDFVFAAALDLSGANGLRGGISLPDVGGLGGPGADDGTPGGVTGSAPPGATRGKGGMATDWGQPATEDPLSASFGHGVGGGLQVEQTIARIGGGGGGGGYGGKGGKAGGYAATGNWGDGGGAYGDDLLTELLGGSGGAGGRFYQSTSGDTSVGGGGGGGGAIELIAEGTLTVSGSLDVSGGVGGLGANIVGGGGGSGGGVILAATWLDITGATIDVSGGDGYRDPDPGTRGYDQGGYGGGGGGGRVALYSYGPILGLSSATVDIAGGLQGLGRFGVSGYDGLPGTFRYFGDGIGNLDDLMFPIPEPSGMLLALLVMPAWLSVRWRRRKA